jgi:hypothetical protein
MRTRSFSRPLSSSLHTFSTLSTLSTLLGLALASACPAVGEGEGEGEEGEGEGGEGEGEEGEGEGGEGEGEGERAFGLVWWNVANDDVDPRVAVAGARSRAELLPAVTLALEGIVDDVASVEFVDARDGSVVVDNAAPFRVDEDAAGNAVAGDYGVGDYAFDVVVRDAAGAELGRETLTFAITADGLDATPDSGAHARHDFWIADGDVRVHRDDNGDYVDDNGAVVVDGDSVFADNRGGGQTFLVSSGGTQLRFAYAVLLPDGFSSTVRYPLVVLLHHGFER